MRDFVKMAHYQRVQVNSNFSTTYQRGLSTVLHVQRRSRIFCRNMLTMKSFAKQALLLLVAICVVAYSSPPLSVQGRATLPTLGSFQRDMSSSSRSKSLWNKSEIG
jgi:hypothetical protein